MLEQYNVKSMIKQNPKNYARALYEATKGMHGKELSDAINRFVRLLAKSQMLKKAERIIAEFINYAKAAEGIIDIKIASTRALDEKIVSRIKQAFGDKVESTETINPKLLGGIVVKSGNMIFDASLQRQLVRLKGVLSK